MKKCANTDCSRNGESISFADFNKKGKGYQPYCRECQKQKAKSDYKNRKKYYSDKAKRNRQAIIDVVRNAKNQPCTDCRQVFPYYVMDLDHLSDKEFSLGHSRMKGMQQVLRELEKCEAVCANCHRERTHKRMKI
jgi:hypothetical protein